MTTKDATPGDELETIFNDVTIYACTLFDALGRHERGADRATKMATRRVLDRLFGALACTSGVSRESIAAWSDPPTADELKCADELRRRYELAKGSM
jgi:hypothetical protein